MSELREELLAPKHLRKRIMGVVIIAGLLIAAFAFSTALISLIFDTQRLSPNNKLADAEDENALLMLPPFPFNESFFKDLFSDLNLTQEELEDLIDMLSEMFDGDISDLDLGIYGAGILALLLSDEEVFRVYDYSTFSNMSDILWRYECFDEYTGDSWKSSASKDVYPFYSYEDHDSLYPNLDILLLKMFLSPNYGMNSLVIPSLFPTPFIMDGSVTAPSLDTSLTVLYKDDFDCTTLDVYFSESNEVGMKYQLFGLELPSGEEINSTAKDEIYTPTNIKNLFLQLPPSIEDYKNNNNYFKHHYDILNGIIEDSDNAFIVANKIRTYLQDNFNFPADADSYNPAPEGRDTVDWFCETEQGVFSDFASAFCVFTRAFGVASRFIDGFNSQSIEQFNDVDEGDKSAFAIKYKNIYNWGEIYVPTDVSGDGDWVQMDILYERYGEGNAWSTDEYNITVSSNFTEGYRGQVANITATLNSTTGSIEGQSITFTDITTGQTLGIASTNAHGNASILVNIDTNQVVGPHDISAQYNPQTEAYTNYTIFDNIRVNLQNINPSEVNISKTPPETTIIQGFVDDPINGQRVKNALISILLFKKGTNDVIGGAFSPGSTVTDSNGNFNEILTVNAPAGIYEVRADFNGTWAGWSKTYYNINDSSNRIQFNVTEELTYNLFFCINGTPTNYPLAPNFGNLLFAKRGEQLNISVNVTSVDYGYPVKDITVQFYDYTNGDVLIGSDITNSEGNASIIYNLNNTHKSGPTLLYVKAGNKKNYTYYILNETIEFNYISGPDPPEINRTGSGSIFNILTFLEDSQTNPINFTQITLKMFKDSIDYSGYLDSPNIYNDVGGSNLFNINNMGVKSDTPLENYTLRLDFNGTFDFFNDDNNQYKAFFDMPDLNCSLVLPMDLCVEDYNYFMFNFFINGTTSDNYTYPRIDRNGHLNLTVNLQWGGHLIENGEWVSFYDVSNDSYIGDVQIYDGIANFTYITTMNTVAGPHLIYVNYSKGGSMEYNYSYFILDVPINISLDKCPSPNTINRSGSSDIIFMVHGYLIDGENETPIKFGRIRVLLFEGIIDRTNFLIGVEGTQQHGTYFDCNKTGEFLMYFEVDDLTPQKNYTLRVDFNGTFYYTGPNTDDLESFYNQHDFYQIDSISSNFSFSAGGQYDLKVKDPEDVLILFKINGTSAITDYDNFNHPLTCKRGNYINFTINVYHSGSHATGGEVRIYDVYNNSFLLQSHDLDANGFHNFTIDTALWHAGLHLIKVNWTDKVTFNSTYIIINDTVSISVNQPSNSTMIRNVTLCTISGQVSNYGINLRGLGVKIVLLENGTFKDVSEYLILSGPQLVFVDDDGTFSFTGFKINESCPQGKYFIKFDFNGSFSHMDAPINIYLTESVVNKSSSPIPLNITAGTSLEGYYYTVYDPDGWYLDDTCYVVGNLTWDNNTRIANMRVNVSGKKGEDIVAINSSFTDAQGKFNITFIVDSAWDEIYISFYYQIGTIGEPDCYYIEQTINLEVFRNT